MSSRRSPASILAPLRRGSPPRPAVSSPAGRRAGALSFGLTLLGALGSGWCLISTGRALGALLRSSSAAGLLAQALAAAALSAVCQLLAQRVARFSAITEEAHLRRLTLAHLLGLGPARAADVRSGATASLLTDGAERVALYRQTFLAPTLAAAAAPLLVLIELAVVVDVVPALVLAAAVIMVPAFIIWCHSRLRASSSDSRRARMRLAAEYLDAIQGLRTLTLARAAERTSARLRLEGESNRRAVMGLLAGNQLVILLTDGLFSLFLITAAAGLALLRLSTGVIDVGDALAIVLTSYVLLEPLAHVGAFFYVGMGGMANQRAIRRILSRPLPHSTTSPGARTSPAATAQSSIVLDDVEATWGADPVLEGVDLSVRRGESLAIVGPSGAGKSTLMAVLAGNLLPSSGSVRVEGTELSAVTQDEVRSASALVAQTTWLFTGTIADNLRLAQPYATPSQMWQALEVARLDKEVALMPEGLETQVGEAGLGLSGGQAQRLSLARAFLADRPVLLLDEPTSQVDLASEAAIVKSIEQLARGRTVVTISHRAGALTAVDRTVRVEAGAVHEAGGASAPSPAGAAPDQEATESDTHEADASSPKATDGDHQEERA
ncbi:ABC transporter ATP-binding protein/permease [Actinomyces oris]|uniref:ABC transporter ATP-binding protein n=1 Tax=Actinomyces oris TaxID=544580 RepID=A0A1Q8V8T1_9ACTO|nr:ABC transporter ATP-binding protein [Actinomyces oris]OLO44513.1 ABC transporter ATP-binding protein [Actinomyces oris]